MAAFGATDLGPHSATREPLFGWLARNVFRLAIYLLAASLAAAMYCVAADETGSLVVPGLTVYFAFVGGFLGIPGAIGWLLIVASLPPEWSTLRRRAVALALSPLIAGDPARVLLLARVPVGRGHVRAAPPGRVGVRDPAAGAHAVGSVAPGGPGRLAPQLVRDPPELEVVAVGDQEVPSPVEAPALEDPDDLAVHRRLRPVGVLRRVDVDRGRRTRDTRAAPSGSARPCGLPSSRSTP